LTLRNFAVDFGNGYVKAKSEQKTLIYSSKMGHESEMGSSSLSELETNYDVGIFQRKDEEKFVLGNDVGEVIEPSRLLSTSDLNNRYDNTLFKRLIDFVLVDLASYENEESIDVRLVTGMPSHELAMSEKRKKFHDYLLGRHIAVKDGKEYVVNVKELKIIEQPLGTLLNEFMNDELKIHKTLKHGNIVVIDLGSGTTIIDYYKNMKRNDGTVINEGMNHFLNHIAKQLTQKVETPIDDEHINRGIRNGKYTAILAETAYPFKQQFELETTKKIQSIMSKYTSVVDQESLVNRFILTGGGANVIGQTFAQEKDNFFKVENPQTAIVNGYFKLAQSLDKHSQT